MDALWRRSHQAEVTPRAREDGEKVLNGTCGIPEAKEDRRAVAAPQAR